VAPDVHSTRRVESMLNALGRHFQGESSETPNPGLKPWAIIFNRFQLRPISPFSYVGQVAVNPGDSWAFLCDHFVVKAHNQELQLWFMAASEF
jgi:hypothetical protein